MELFDLIKKSDTEYRVNFGDSIYANHLCASIHLSKYGDIQVVITYDTHWLQEMRFKDLLNVKKYFQLHGRYLLDDAECIWHKVSHFKIDLCEEIYEHNKEFLCYGQYYDEDMVKTGGRIKC